MNFDAFALSISGRRDNNEDAICAQPDLGLFVVADGMGGYEGGEIASALAVEAIHELVRRTAGDADVTWPYKIDPQRTIHENEIIVATRLANERICARRIGELGEMGSTVAVLRFAPGTGPASEGTQGDDVCAIIGHVGDSRVYRMRDGVVEQLTIDHSLANQLIAAGMSPGADFAWRHVVTRALGTASGVPDVMRAHVRRGDVFLLCSDGLSEVLPPERIAELLSAPAEIACRALVEAAYVAGSRDNISAIVVRAC
ncbi:MAG: PP2C family serine/threonine-protein phosphatase [Kofleriaceae bacterium]